MPADTLSRKEIERVQENLDTLGFVDLDDATMLLQATLTEPARLASARAEGVREGIERCAAEARRYADLYPQDADGRNVFTILAEHFDHWRSALSPPPAEPTGMTDDGWIEWKGGECPVEPDAVVEVRMRDGRTATFDDGAVDEFWWGNDGCSVDILAYRIVKPAAEPSTPVAPDWPTRCTALEADGIAARKRVVALEAENAALKARNVELVEGLRPFAEVADWYGEPIADDREIEIERPYGHFRRARALLQGGPDAG